MIELLSLPVSGNHVEELVAAGVDHIEQYGLRNLPFYTLSNAVLSPAVPVPLLPIARTTYGLTDLLLMQDIFEPVMGFDPTSLAARKHPVTWAAKRLKTYQPRFAHNAVNAF
ncbi:hypothetical protein [uncultured Enorma sp.]|uniref:hypothetical protein n=1 Tax=uncultured Enorma sp. TaxID=1714346 RepID=UPI002598A2C2|nr:hypothetical protein [uncultured Enorma sp.]